MPHPYEEIEQAATILAIAKWHIESGDKRGNMLIETLLKVFPDTPAAEEAAQLLLERIGLKHQHIALRQYPKRVGSEFGQRIPYTVYQESL